MKKENVILRPYQEKAIEAVNKRIEEGKKEIIVEIATGAGKSLIMKEIAKQFPKEEVMILTRRRMVKEQLKQHFTDVDIVLYQECFAKINNKLKYILLNEIEIISQERYERIREGSPNATLIIFTNMIHGVNWLKRENICFSYSMNQALSDGYLTTNCNGMSFENFFCSILERQKFSEIKREVVIATR